jgi:alkaline phosphatase
MKQIMTLLIAGLSYSVLASPAPKNVIMVVGDGMGPAYTSAYRMFVDDASTPVVEQTVFDRMLVGMASTHPDLGTGYVTDSAAGATALSTGVKTYNGAIGVDVDKTPHLTVLELAKKQGRKTGIAVTSQINHATPAGFSAHNESRHNYEQIADSYFDDKIDGKFVLDVMLGGGWKYFLREDRNIVDQFKQAGYHYIDKMAQLEQAETGKPLIGLFADVGLPWALDSEGQTRLGALAKTAVRVLENDQGYFLLIEASQVDWAGHGNDVAGAMAEMHDLALTLEWLEQYVESNPGTLLVVTADHSTGGLTIGVDGIYNWDPEPLKQLKASPQKISESLMALKERGKFVSEMLGIELTKEEKQQLDDVEVNQQQLTNSKKVKNFHKIITGILDKRSHTGWTTEGHTGVDVQIFAKGLGSEKFSGHLDNTQIADKLFELLNSKK